MSIKLKQAVLSLEKRYGKGTVMVGEETVSGVEFIPSGSLRLDSILGGGFAKGRVIEIFGEESSGKSTLAIHACVEAQKLGLPCVYIDHENAFDPVYARNLGIDMSEDLWLFAQPTHGEESFDIIEEFLSTNEVGVIVVDSVAAMVPKGELDGDFGDSKMGLHARLMSQGFRKLIGKINKSDTCLIFINQMRDKIGVMFGDPKTTTGGNALKFYASQRLKITRVGSNKDGEEAISNNVRVEIKKNKVAPPFKKCDLVIEFGVGLDRYSEILSLAVELEIVKKTGSWYSYEDTKLGQGEAAVKKLLKDNPELMDELEIRVKKNLIK